MLQPVQKLKDGNPITGYALQKPSIVGPGYQPGCIILRVGNLVD
jgi:hypothetical protein